MTLWKTALVSIRQTMEFIDFTPGLSGLSIINDCPHVCQFRITWPNGKEKFRRTYQGSSSPKPCRHLTSTHVVCVWTATVGLLKLKGQQLKTNLIKCDCGEFASCQTRKKEECCPHYTLIFTILTWFPCWI